MKGFCRETDWLLIADAFFTMSFDSQIVFFDKWFPVFYLNWNIYSDFLSIFANNFKDYQDDFNNIYLNEK